MASTHIKIWLKDKELNAPFAAELMASLESQNLDSLVFIEEAEHSDIEEWLSQLATKQRTIGVISMEKLPAILPRDIKIMALSTRTDPRAHLYLKEGLHIQKLNTEKGLHILANERSYMLQMAAEFEHQKFEFKEKITIDDLEHVDAILSNRALAISNSIEPKKIDPGELIPLPGAGVMACLCRADDMVLRKELMIHHNHSVAKHTNIERKLKREFPDLLGAHSYTKENGDTMFYFSTLTNEGRVIKEQLCQNTYIGLADNMISLLNNKRK